MVCRIGGAKRSWPPAPSAARRSCSCPASARRACCSSIGSPLVLDAPGVGENLQDHLQIRMRFQDTGRENTQHDGRQLVRQDEDRPRICAASKAARCRWRRRNWARLPSPTRARPAPISSTTCSRCRWTNSATRCIRSRRSPPACAICARLRAATCASASGLATAAPKITPNYLSTEEDRKIAASSLTLTRNIVAAPALQKICSRRN